MKSVTKHIRFLGLLIAFTLSNVEVSHAGDLTGYDADGDGLIDYLDDSGNLWPNQQAWEESSAFFTAITGSETETSTNVQPPADSDGDGLTDNEEATLGTNPFVVDTDGGGLSDYEEVKDEDWRNTDPLNSADDFPNNIPATSNNNENSGETGGGSAPSAPSTNEPPPAPLPPLPVPEPLPPPPEPSPPVPDPTDLPWYQDVWNGITSFVETYIWSDSPVDAATFEALGETSKLVDPLVERQQAIQALIENVDNAATSATNSADPADYTGSNGTVEPN